MQPDQLIADLLARGDINDDTTAQLNRMLEDWRASKLDPDDEAYLRALHGRLTNVTPEPAEEPMASAPARVDGLTLEEWRDRALKAEAELATAEESTRNG
ncbi:MAG: hypothetical protein ABIY37_10290 [Devosia sp.]